MRHRETFHVTQPSDRELRFTRDFDAPRDLVFDCWTKAELVKRWLCGPDGWYFAVCEIDLRVGGGYRYVWAHPDGQRMGLTGTYKAVTPPEKLVSTELFDEDWTGGEAEATLELGERAGRTTATLTVLYSSQSARDGAAQSGADQGLAAGYDRLEALLESLAS